MFSSIVEYSDEYDKLPPICQINMEVHNPALYGLDYNSFYQNFRRLLDSRRYVVLNDDYTGEQGTLPL